MGEKKVAYSTQVKFFFLLYKLLTYIYKKNLTPTKETFFLRRQKRVRGRRERGKKKISGMVGEKKIKILNFQASLRHMRQVYLYFRDVLTENF